MLLISGLCFANWREASPVHVNRCLQRSGYLNAAQAIQAMREQYKIFFFSHSLPAVYLDHVPWDQIWQS